MTGTAYFQDLRAASHKLCDTPHRGSLYSWPKVLKICLEGSRSGDVGISWAGEDQHIRAVKGLFKDQNLDIEVKNQARIHLWYEAKLDTKIAPLKNQFEGIDGFLNVNAAIGLYKTGEEISVYAPYGLEDLFNLIVRPNPNSRTKDPHFYSAKTKRWKETWPEINVISYA